MTSPINKIFVSFLLVVAAISCAKKVEDDDTFQDNDSYVIQTAVLQAGAIAASAEAPSPVGFQSLSLRTRTQQPNAACDYSSFTTCVGPVAGTYNKTIDWNACTAKSATLTGSWTERFNTNACCSSFTNGCNMTRLTGSNGSSIIYAGGAVLTTSSESHQNYLGNIIPGDAGVNITNSGGISNSIAINGLHRILKGPKGTVWFDHSIRTSQNLVIGGNRLQGDRTINAGAIDVFHNLGKYTATTTFSSATPVVWGNSGCCYPTSGTVSTVFSNKTGTATLTFSTVCGVASMTDTIGGTTSVIMSPCD